MEISRGWGASKVKIFYGQYEAKLEFLVGVGVGVGVKSKKLLWGGHGDFFGTAYNWFNSKCDA